MLQTVDTVIKMCFFYKINNNMTDIIAHSHYVMGSLPSVE